MFPSHVMHQLHWPHPTPPPPYSNLPVENLYTHISKQLYVIEGSYHCSEHFNKYKNTSVNLSDWLTLSCDSHVITLPHSQVIVPVTKVLHTSASHLNLLRRHYQHQTKTALRIEGLGKGQGRRERERREGNKMEKEDDTPG